jgi:hypothetical protein
MKKSESRYRRLNALQCAAASRKLNFHFFTNYFIRYAIFVVLGGEMNEEKND